MNYNFGMRPGGSGVPNRPSQFIPEGEKEVVEIAGVCEAWHDEITVNTNGKEIKYKILGINSDNIPPLNKKITLKGTIRKEGETNYFDLDEWVEKM